MEYQIGQEVYHPKHGTLELGEWNEQGQLFCFDENDKFYLFNATDKGVTVIEDEVDEEFELTEDEQRAEDTRRVQIGWALDPDAKGILITVEEDNTWGMTGRNMGFEEMFFVVQTLYGFLSQQQSGASADRN